MLPVASPGLEQLEQRTLLAITSGALGQSLTVFSTGDDPIAITCVARQVKINGADPDTGAALCDQLTSALVKGGPGNNNIDLRGVQVTAFASLTSVTVEGLGGSDIIMGSEFSDLLIGGLGDDQLAGGDGEDVLLGGEGSDSLFGDADDDVLSGGVGEDRLDGGAGEDLVEASDDANFRLTDAQLRGQRKGGSIETDELSSIEQVHLIGGVGDNTIDASAFSGFSVLEGGPGHDVLLGSPIGSFLLGEDGDDSLFGGAGNDTLAGGQGNDALFSGSGLDILLGGTGHDSLDAGDDADFLDGGTGNDVLEAGPGDDTIDSGAGNDGFAQGLVLRFQGRGGGIRDGDLRSTLFPVTVDTGSFGAVTDLDVEITVQHTAVEELQVALIPPPETGLGSILLVASGSASGIDFGTPLFDRGTTFDQDALISIVNGTAPYTSTSFKPEQSLDVVNGLAANGTWTLAITDVSTGNVGTLLNWELRFTLGGGGGAGIPLAEPAGGSDGNDTIDGGPGVDLIDFTLAVRRIRMDLVKQRVRGQGSDVITGVENAIGSSFSDILMGNNAANWFRGGGGNDQLVGNGDNDVLEGEGGNDKLYGGTGADRLDGGLADDLLDGGLGNDTLLGKGGRDQLRGGAGLDLLEGGDGDDVLRGGDDADTLQAGSGRDALFGDSGNDFLDGGLDNDLLRGGDGNDALTGDEGNDRLLGERGSDVADGGPGDDELRGGDDDDTLVGGPGVDDLLGESGFDQLFSDVFDKRVLQ